MARVLDRVRDGVVVLDRDLRYAYLNERAEEMVGAARGDLLGEHVWDVFPESADSVARTRMETVRESGTPTSYERYNPEAGSHVRVDVHPHGDGLVLVFADVTEQKASTRQLDRLFETAPVGLVVVDTEGAIERANSRAERLLGLERAEIESRTYDQPEWEIWDEDGDPIPIADHPVTRVFGTGDPMLGFTHGIGLPDGTERWLSSNCAPVRDDEGEVAEVVVALEDVTDLKRLDRFIRVIRPVDDLLNGATGRPELERGVCETLAAAPLYDVAWLASARPGADDPEIRAWSGDGDLRPGAVEAALRTDGSLSAAIAMQQMRDRVESGTGTIEDGLGALDDIVEEIETANEGVQSINDATDEQAASSQEVVAMVDEVTAVSEETTAEAQNVSAAAEEQTAAVGEIAGSAERMSERADALEGLVATFEVDADGVAAVDEAAGLTDVADDITEDVMDEIDEEDDDRRAQWPADSEGPERGANSASGSADATTAETGTEARRVAEVEPGQIGEDGTAGARSDGGAGDGADEESGPTRLEPEDF